MTVFPVRFLLGFLLCSSLFAAGCGTYRNITAYFNTYYNTSKIFDEAVTEANKAPQTARDSNYFAPYKLAQGTIVKFEKVIEKGSKVIQFHGESAYVEDAILMIGKSYLYQNETESAASKFRELIDNFPASDHRYEAKLWLSKALYQGKNDQEALITAKELTAERGRETEIADDLLLEAMMLEAQIYEDRGEYNQASETLNGIEVLDGSAELKTIALYQLGSVHEQTSDYFAAARAYGSVQDYKPTPAMRFNARLRQGVMLSRAGQSELALETFDEIIAWPLKPAESALVDYEIATAYWEKGDSASAFTLYAIIDSTYKKTDASARANFTRAEIMRTKYGDFASAKKYYEKAKTEFAASPVTPQAARRFTTFDHYFKTHQALVKDDSLFLTVLHRDTTAPAGAAIVENGKIPDAPEEGSDVAQASPPDDESRKDEGGDVPPDPRNITQLVSGENLDMRAIRLRPRHLVADMLAAMEEPETGPGGSTPDGVAGSGKKSATGRGAKSPGKAPVKPKENVTPEQLAERIAANKYELGGLHFLDLELPDSALYWYGRVVKDHPGSPLVPKAFYAMSEVYRSRGDTGAFGLLQDAILTDFPESEYAAQILKSRGLDTVAVAEDPLTARYREAEELLSQEKPGKAIARFKKIYSETRDTVVAPKSCYAVGWIYENVLHDLDSAEAWYGTLIRDFPNSVYARSAGPKVTVKQDTSKLGQFVKFQEIKPVPKPVKKGFGLVRKEGAPAANLPPGQDPFSVGQPGGTGVIINPGDESDDEEVEEEEPDDPEEEEDPEEDDGGDEDTDPGFSGMKQLPPDTPPL